MYNFSKQAQELIEDIFLPFGNERANQILDELEVLDEQIIDLEQQRENLAQELKQLEESYWDTKKRRAS